MFEKLKYKLKDPGYKAKLQLTIWMMMLTGTGAGGPGCKVNTQVACSGPVLQCRLSGQQQAVLALWGMAQ